MPIPDQKEKTPKIVPQKKSGFLIFILVFIIICFLAIDAFLVYFFILKKQVENGSNKQPIVVQQLPDFEPIKADLAVAGKRLIEAGDLDLYDVDVNPQVPQYQLPLNLSNIDNQDVITKLNLSDQAKELLSNNGFAVTNSMLDAGKQNDDFSSFYSDLKWQDLPLFITSDSLLHFYHIFFDTTLMKLERDLFYDDLWQMSSQLYNNSLKTYNNSTGEIKEAARRNLTYLAVGLELLKPEANQIASDETLKEEYCHEFHDDEFCDQIIADVKNQYGEQASLQYFSVIEADKYSFSADQNVIQLVSQETNLISEHKGWKASPLFIYEEDYSQYVPRGHYTKSEKLKNYFKAMMWYGRMTALINGDENIPVGKAKCDGRFTGIISVDDAKIQTLQASLIAQDFSANKQIQDLWQRMYAITAYFVGFSDDLGPYEYSQSLANVLGNEYSVNDIADNFNQLKSELNNMSYSPKIYSGLGKCELFLPELPLDEIKLQQAQDQAKMLLGQTKGFRLMGQRFTLDSYIFSEIVSPYSGEYSGEILPLLDNKLNTFTWDDAYPAVQENRPFSWSLTPVKREVKGFPRGLDVMAVFGSQRAKEILKQTGDDQYSQYEDRFTELSNEVKNIDQADWYQNLYYNWLYTLQGLLKDYDQGYPTFMQTTAWQDKQLNAALASWSELRHDTILYVKQSYTMAELGGVVIPEVAGYVEPVPDFYARLIDLTELTKRGLEKLVPEENLTEMQVIFALNDFNDILKKLINISKKELANEALTEIEYNFIADFGSMSQGLVEQLSGGEVDQDIFKTVMVADVHTDGNSAKVLEEGVGYIKTMLVAYKLPDERTLIGVGPVFSYYEFKQDMAERLTDEAWRAILDSDNKPDQPGWVKSFTE